MTIIVKMFKGLTSVKVNYIVRCDVIIYRALLRNYSTTLHYVTACTSTQFCFCLKSIGKKPDFKPVHFYDI